MENYLREIREKIGATKSVVLFGASRGCLYTIRLLRYLGYDIECILETKSRPDKLLYANKYVHEVLGIPVYSVEEGLEKYPNSVVLVTLLDIFNLRSIIEILTASKPKAVLYLMPEIIFGYLSVFTKKANKSRAFR
jgi:hypothetical protein